MRFLSLIRINLQRHRSRAIIGVAGIAFGVAAMITILAIVSGAIGMFEHILNSDSDFLVFEKNASDLFFSSVNQSELAQIQALPIVGSCSPILFGIVSSPGHPVITCFGLSATDSRFSKADWVSGDRQAFGKKTGGIVLGSRAAEFLKAKYGETVLIGPTSLRVDGIIKLENGFENGGAFLPLSEAQNFFHRPGTYSVVAVKLRDRTDGNKFKEEVEKNQLRLVAMENREFDRSYNSFRILRATSWAVGACAFLLGGLGVANTMLMSVFSRVREIAILRVCGFSKGQLIALVFGEASAIACLGLLFGSILSFGLLLLIPYVPQFQGYLQAQINLRLVAGVCGLSLVTAALGALYPARMAVRIQPAEALRYE